MVKTLDRSRKQERVKFRVPRSVQEAIPIRRIWPDGIFQVGNQFSKSFSFTDINYAIAGKDDKTAMFLDYSELLNTLDSGASAKVTINNRRINKCCTAGGSAGVHDCGILQMLLTLWFRPIICFLISAIIMLASAYFCAPVFIVNYAFCIRSNEILTNGFSFTFGVLYALALSLLCILIGRRRFQNFDLC